MITSIVKTTEVLGVPITCFCSYDHATGFIVERIRERRQTFCVAINPEKVCSARRDPAFGDIVRRGHVHICDGVGTAVAVRWITGWRIPRITGVELFLALVETAARAGLRVFLLGAKSEVNQRAGAVLREKYPELHLAGQHDGYFHDVSEIIRQVNNSGADMLFAALGSPRQEWLLGEHLEEIQTPFCMGVGGSFDVLAGNIKRAPEFVRRTGMEFLFRLLREPRRWRRQSVLPGFAVRVLVEAVGARGLKALVSSREIRAVYGAGEEAGGG